MAPCMAPSLLVCLEGVPGPRSPHARRHPLTSLLFMARTLGTVLAVGVFAHHAATECQRSQQDCHH